MTKQAAVLAAVLGVCAVTMAAAAPALDERPAAEGEWGYRPEEGEQAAVNPPRFSWRPQKGARGYVVEASRDATFGKVEYRAEGVGFNVHAPAKEFEPGAWAWRWRFVNEEGQASGWSAVRRFTVSEGAVRFAFPGREELLSRVPEGHPRVFVRPEWMGKLRERAKGDLKEEYARLIAQCEKWVKSPPKVEEPPTYPPGTEFKSEQWREYWGRGMRQTPATLDPMVTLGLAYHLSGDRRYGEAGKRILMEVAKWDPKGATGYRYNDEAGMPYNYLFARGYSFLNELLTEEERAECRRVMTIRGREMYEHLCPGHFWTPYKSHENRAWHFLGEVAVAFKGEIPEADDWLWFACNVFASVYPVWNDSDGGWHEGIAYWRSYMDRFSWWADVMKAAVGIDAYKLPYFSQVGYYGMYVQPPGTKWGGFGDQTQDKDSAGNVRLMDTFAAQAGNPYWRWYVEAHAGGQPERSGYVGFVRAATLPDVKAKAPTDLPTSRVFRGVGQAYLNTSLMDARRNVQVLFKSSPFGTQSHGYNAQNSVELYVAGVPIFLSSGVRDIYGSDHHAKWMWETRSCNNVLVGGKGQGVHSRTAVGEIAGFHTSERLDWVRGEAGAAYQEPLKRFTRDVLLVKPAGVVVMVDRLEGDEAETHQWLLHAQERMQVSGQDVRVEHQGAACRVSFVSPEGLRLTQTDRFDPPPRERIQLTQYHLTTETTAPAKTREFVTVMRAGKAGDALGGSHEVKQTDDGLELTVTAGDGRLVVRTRRQGPKDLEATLYDGAGRVVGALP